MSFKKLKEKFLQIIKKSNNKKNVLKMNIENLEEIDKKIN